MPAVTDDPTAQAGKFVVFSGSPPLAPGMCGLCNTSRSDIKYINTHMDLEWLGTLYVCENCAIEMGHVLGMLTKAESDDLLDDNRILTERNTLLTEQVASLEQHIDILSQRRLADRVSGNSHSLGNAGSEEQAASEAVPTDNSGLKDGQPEAEEPVTEQGPDDVSNVRSGDSSILGIDI